MLSTLKIDNLLEERLDIADIDKVLSFMHLMKERLQSDGNRHVYLVLTHGDFCPANMLNTKEGLKILDWESAAYRSALFDFYSYFFFRPLHQEYPLEELVPELMAGLTFFLSKLTLMPSEVLANVKRYEKANRWLFYVERIYMLVERVKYDTKLDVAGNILRYIDVFNKYEELLTDKRIDSHGRAHGTKIYTLRADNKHIRPRLKTRSSA
jgi:aminoglycoside phosphotransferase (APT) family kinase protein